jgi:GntR family transcriptional regulator, trehalose operon transcriptional repressor
MNKYDLIYEELVRRIESGQLPDGARVPSETELMAAYAASRGTVRRAVELLQERGYVQKMHGKGVFVLRPEHIEFRANAIVSFREVYERLGRPVRTTVVELATLAADAVTAPLLGVTPGSELRHVKRVRNIDGENVILDVNWFVADIVPGITREIAESSIYRHIEGELGLQISYAERVIEAQPVTDDDRRYLDLRGMTHVIVVRNRTHLYDGRQFEYTESRHRLDRFQFADVARR